MGGDVALALGMFCKVLEGNFTVLEVNVLVAGPVNGTTEVVLRANIELMRLGISEDEIVALELVGITIREVVEAAAALIMAEVDLGKLSSSGIVGIETISMLRNVDGKGIVVSAVEKWKRVVRSERVMIW